MLSFFLLSILACSPQAPVAEPAVEVVEPLPGRVVVALPADLSGDLSLQLAAFHAGVAGLDGWVFDVGAVRSAGQRYALTDEVVVATLSSDTEGLTLQLCRPECVLLGGDGAELATEVAALLDPAGDPLIDWALPTDKSLSYSQRGARVLYGFHEPVLRKRVGSRRDPVARAPREAGATLLTSWIQGQRDVRIGRSVPGAQALQVVARELQSPSATYDMAGAYLSADWVDEAWDAVRHHSEPDLRFRALYGHIAVHRGRPDEGQSTLDALPEHPETHRLAYLLDGSADSLAAWRASAPADLGAWTASWVEALRSGRGDELEALMNDAPVRPEGVESSTLVELLDIVSTLDGLLTDAESVARETAILQNRFGERRSSDAVPCADEEAMGWVDGAYELGVRHRDLVQQTRAPHAALEEHLDDAQLLLAVGEDYAADLASLTERFDAQMRTSKVIRSYHERILLARVCPDRT